MNYVSIKSVLAQLSLTLDDRYFNEAAMLEHATRACRQMNIEAKLEARLAEIEVDVHKATVPAGFKYLIQVSGNAGSVTNPSWSPMRLTTSPYHLSITLDHSITKCNHCQYEFSISPSGIITTTMGKGSILMAYLAYPTDEEGYALIPDDENVKEAIFHYILYRYWMQKDMMKEEGAEKRMRFHLSMWTTLAQKSLSLNLPDTNQMENLKNMYMRLVPRSNRFAQMFQNIGEREYVNF